MGVGRRCSYSACDSHFMGEEIRIYRDEVTYPECHKLESGKARTQLLQYDGLAHLSFLWMITSFSFNILSLIPF